eukprot:5003326-Pleurochrysis_carterae.AAC.2
MIPSAFVSDRLAVWLGGQSDCRTILLSLRGRLHAIAGALLGWAVGGLHGLCGAACGGADQAASRGGARGGPCAARAQGAGAQTDAAQRRREHAHRLAADGAAVGRHPVADARRVGSQRLLRARCRRHHHRGLPLPRAAARAAPRLVRARDRAAAHEHARHLLSHAGRAAHAGVRATAATRARR